MRKTKFIPGNYYHILNRGNEKRRIFFEKENYLFFLRRLKKGVEKSHVKVICYCLMPNHFHLILQESGDDTISNLMMSLQISYAKAINKHYNRVGHLFQGPFKSIHIDRDGYLVHLSRYLHRNPVEAGLVKEPKNWEFSSYRDYIGLRDGSLPDPEIILSQFPDREAYRQFVQEYKDEDKIKGYTLE